MSALTDLKAQSAQAACFKCLPVDTAQAIKTYLLAVIAGGSVDPKTLLSQARGFFAIPSGMLPAVQATLSATLAGTTVPGIVSQSPCAAICQTVEDSLAIQLWSLANKAGGSMDPKTLAKLAACFVCIPTGRQASVQAFLMAVIAGVVPAPPAIPAGQTGPAPTGPPPTVPPTILKTAIKQFALPPKFVQMIIGDAIFLYGGGGGATGVKPGTPTGFSFVLASDHSIINVSWDVPPAGVTTTELWTSSDNITFALEGSINAPGAVTTSPAPATGATKYGKIRWCNIGGCGGFTAVQSVTNTANPALTTWLTNITNNGGAPPSNGTAVAINSLLYSLDTAGVTAKIYTMCVFVPDSIIAARTPVITNGGNNPWGTGGYTVADLSVNGITGKGAGLTYLDPGVVSAFTNNFFTLTQSCIFFYAYTKNSVANGTDTGTFDGATSQNFDSNFNGAGLQTFSDLLGQGCRLSVNSPGNGFYMASRIAANDNKIYFANSSTPWSAIASNALGGSNMITTGFLVFSFNNNGTITQPSNSVLSAVGYAKGLTTAEGQALYNAMQACRVALGGGFR